MLFKASSSRSHAARLYQQKRQQQQRLLIVGVIAFFLACLSCLAVWGVCQAATKFFQPLPVHTGQFEAYMEQEFGFSKNPPSLLYAGNNLDYNLLAHPAASLFKNKLLPILPVSEDRELKARIEQLFAEYPASKYTPHFYFYNPQTNTYVEINGYGPAPAASVIKLPILLDYLMSLDENLITVDTPLLYAEFHRAGGAGELQYRPTGQDFKANDVASQMIRISDNTCTNMMISYLGGTDAVNQRLSDLGLVNTRIRNWLPDLTGTNTISPYEMVTILNNIDHGPLISEVSRYNGISILESTHNRRLLVAPLPNQAIVAHKTGDIGTAIGDSGIVYMPDGRKYYISMQVERPYNDYTVRDMVQRTSRLLYDYVASQPPTGNDQPIAAQPAVTPLKTPI